MTRARAQGSLLLLASAVWMALSLVMEYGPLFDLHWALSDGGLLLVLETVGVLLPLTAALVFAFGSRDGGSVVAQSRLGIIAIAIFAVVLPLLFLVGELRGAVRDVADGVALIYLVFYLIQIAAGIVAVREIARAGVIPRSRRDAYTSPTEQGLEMTTRLAKDPPPGSIGPADDDGRQGDAVRSDSSAST